jgi:hypothetical protein
MRHMEIKSATTKFDIEETSCSSTSWGWVGKERWEEMGVCAHRYVYIQTATKTYTNMAQTATIIL